MDINTEKDCMCTLIKANSKGYSGTICFMGKEDLGFRQDNMLGPLLKGKWKGEGLLNGKMVRSTKESTTTIKNMAWEGILLQMVKLTKECGLTESEMEKEF